MRFLEGKESAVDIGNVNSAQKGQICRDSGRAKFPETLTFWISKFFERSECATWVGQELNR